MKHALNVGHAAQETREAITLREAAAEAHLLGVWAAEDAEAARRAEWERVEAEMEAEDARLCAAMDAAFQRAAQEIGEEYDRLVEEGDLPRRAAKGADITLTEAEQEAAVLSLRLKKAGDATDRLRLAEATSKAWTEVCINRA